MPKIRILDPAIANKIAAGEVVERPSSVVKELAENSLDAGASRIDVEIEDGGKQLIRVTDNGVGIEPEDLPLAFASHATSKLNRAEDLFAIATLGFRGEALASIGSVADARIVSRHQGRDEGMQIECRGGEIGQVKACGASQGTIVEVRNLFHNVPVRRKFLKSSASETAHVTETLTRMALAYPGVHFRFLSNGREVFHCPPSTRLERITMFYGRDLAESLVEIDSRSPEVTLQGHAALPATNRANRTWQLLFLNGRFIQDKSVNHAMNEAYRGLIQEHRFPIVFLFLEMSPSEVDVNVHPTKLEVRFRSGYNLYGRVIGCIRSALLADERVARLEVDAQPTLFNTSPSCRPDGDQRPEEPVGGSPVVPAASAGRPAGPERRPDAAHPSAPGSRERERPGPSGAAVNARRSPRMPGSGGAPQVPSSAFRRHFPLPPAEGAASASAPGSAQAGATEPLTGPSHEVPARVPPPQAAAVTPRESFGSADHTPRQRELDGTLGPGHPPQFVQIHNAYIVQETSEGFIVVDQHALHERILYWELTQKAQQQQMETQRLLLPEPVDVTPKELAMARELRPVLKELGLEVEEFGRSSLVIQSVPSFLRDANPSQLLHDILSELGEGERPRSLERIREHILSTMACRGAVRFGDRLTADQIASLLERAARIPESVSCAHGRPTRLSVSLKDLGRQFGRT